MGCLHLAMALADREVEMANKSLVFENLHRAVNRLPTSCYGIGGPGSRNGE